MGRSVLLQVRPEEPESTYNLNKYAVRSRYTSRPIKLAKD